MKIETKYNIGDEVYFVIEMTLFCEKIDRIIIDKVGLIYKTIGGAVLNEHELFPTKESAKEYLINKIKDM